MNERQLIVLLGAALAVAVAVIVFLLLRPGPQGAIVEPEPVPVPEQVRELAHEQRAAIEAGIRGRETGRGVVAMETVLEAWNPVGHRKDTVTNLLGEPTEESDEALVYRFDSGLGGWQWTLALDTEEKVSDVERQSLE